MQFCLKPPFMTTFFLTGKPRFNWSGQSFGLFPIILRFYFYFVDTVFSAVGWSDGCRRRELMVKSDSTTKARDAQQLNRKCYEVMEVLPF
jgi:hypothetical protein